MSWKSKEFKKLKKEWEQNLKNSGFVDVEKDIGGDRVLKQSSDYAFRRKETTQDVREAKETYFALLSEWVQKESFEDDVYSQLTLFKELQNISPDRLIMERTAEGKTIQEISREMKLLGLFKHNRDTIRYIRRRYEDKWGIKSWNKEEMVSRRVLIQCCHILQTHFLFNI